MADIDLIPAIAEKTWEAISQKVAVVAPFVSWIHLHISDGTMGVPETLVEMSGLRSLSHEYPNLSFEAHLFTANPEKYVRQLADAGCGRLIAHVESNDPRRFLDEAKYDEVDVGIAIDGATEIDQVEPFLEEVDFVVVMTAEAGEGTFLPEAVEKVKMIRQSFPDLPIEVVGGITETTAKTVKDAGASRIVASDFIFHDPTGVAEAIETLKSA